MLDRPGDIGIKSVTDSAQKIRVAILEDQQSIIDGYQCRLSLPPALELVGAAAVPKANELGLIGKG